MTQAAVGFQCPDCVKEGQRSVRQPRTRFGGTVTGQPHVTSMVLIGINVAVWLAVLATGGSTGSVFRALALLPRSAGMQLPDGQVVLVKGVADGAWWQLLTSAFTHAEVWHIGFNMLALWFLGPQLEQLVGRLRFLGIYFASALAGSAAVMLLSQTNAQTMGASGAIFGLMGALLVLGLRLGANMQPLVFWVGLNLAMTFTMSGISWQGHVGGLVGGAVAAAAVAWAPPSRRTTVQWLGIGAVALVAVVLCVVRAINLG